MLINWILEGLELHLERIWDALGRSWASSWRSWTALGCFLDVQNPIFFREWPKMVSRGLLNRFWVDLGKDWGGFLEHMGGFGEDFPLFWLPLGRFVQEAFEMIWGGF